MKILLAPDSFKNCLSARQFCSVATAAILREEPEAEVISLPLADGGEGTVDAIIGGTRGRYEKRSVTSAAGKQVVATFGITQDGQTAIIETASASGLVMAAGEKNDPLTATSFGTGELIRHALDAGVNKIVLGLGGSATNDGGAGLLQALGVKLLDENLRPIERGGRGLLSLKTLDFSTLDGRLQSVEFIAACDVTNPLLGPQGASYVYGPQKGADPQACDMLEKALTHFAGTCVKARNHDFSQLCSAGAAGGLGFAVALLGGKLVSGFTLVAEMIGLERIIADGGFDLIMSGEGKFDQQTFSGKLLSGIFTLAENYAVPVIVLCGTAEISDSNFTAYPVFSIVNRPMPLTEAMQNAEILLGKCVQNCMKTLKIGKRSARLNVIYQNRAPISR